MMPLALTVKDKEVVRFGDEYLQFKKGSGRQLKVIFLLNPKVEVERLGVFDTIAEARQKRVK
jgi:hypothetical protein